MLMATIMRPTYEGRPAWDSAPVSEGPTPYAELNALLADLVARQRAALGETFVGAYVQGSFALGAGDLHSDCDFITVVSEPVEGERLEAIRALHDEIPQREGHWCHHLEGSYAVAEELRTLVPGVRWPFVDHGWRTVDLDEHCNTWWVRWILRERGIVLAGPSPRTLVDPVPPEQIRAAARAALPTVVEDVHAWAPREIAWCQRYLVTQVARSLHTASTGEVASKRGALEWARTRFGEGWTPLLDQVIADRERGFDPDEPPRPGSLQAAHAFAAYAAQLVEAW
jgi:hypothetical protein